MDDEYTQSGGTNQASRNPTRRPAQNNSSSYAQRHRTFFTRHPNHTNHQAPNQQQHIPQRQPQQQPVQMSLDANSLLMILTLTKAVQGLTEELHQKNAIEIAKIKHEDEVAVKTAEAVAKAEAADKQNFEENIRFSM